MAGMRDARRIVALAVATAALALPSAASAAPGDVYTADFSTATVWRLGPTGGDTAFSFGANPGLDDVAGMTQGPDGAIYAGDQDGDVWRIDRTSAAEALWHDAGTFGAHDVVFDASGRALVLSGGSDQILAIDPVTKAQTILYDGPGTYTYESLDVLRNGDIFLTDYTNDRVMKLSGGALTPLISGDAQLNGPNNTSHSADERYLFISSSVAQGILRLDLRTGEKLFNPLGFGPRAVVPMRDGRLMVSAIIGIFTTPNGVGSPTLFSNDDDMITPADLAIEPDLCAGRTPTVVGTDGRDVIRGSAFPDVISTLGGKDVVSGLAGNDIACGGPGKDTLRGGGGRDRLLGQGGKDKLIGGKGKDALKGGAGRDVQRQ